MRFEPGLQTSRSRLYHEATAADGRQVKLCIIELHKDCRIEATFWSTQVRVPPGARNFYRRKFISFLPFLLSLFVSIETSTLSPPTRALPRYKEEVFPLTDYQWSLSHWVLVSLECPEFYLVITIVRSVSPNGGRTWHRWFPKSRVLPLGHSDWWKFDEVIQLYIANPLSKLRKLEEGQVRNPPGARNLSSTQLSPMATHASCNPCCVF